MRTETPSQSSRERELTRLEGRVKAQLVCREHSSASLAAACEVSAATMSRVLLRLRKKLAKEGLELRSVRGPGGWHYEIKGESERRHQAWQKLLTEIESWPRGKADALREVDHDTVIYER